MASAASVRARSSAGPRDTGRRRRGDAAALHIDDLADPDAAPRLVRAALAAFGKLDALVNNAARVERGTIETTAAAAFDRVIAVNVRAPLLLIRAALPELSRARGAVLNIGSINAWSGEPTFVAYSASKGALMTLTRNLGDTLHRENGVRVNQINPDRVLTENEKRVQERQGNVPDWYLKVPKVFAPPAASSCPRTSRPPRSTGSGTRAAPSAGAWWRWPSSR